MEDYKKKYEQALERAKEQSSKYGIDKVVLEEVFPELKESEDARIRKEILEYFKQFDNMELRGAKISDWIVWLEKQGEKVDVIKNFNTEFERQISHLIASTINKEHEYNEGFVKWTANALLNYAKHELEKQGEQKSAWSEDDKLKMDTLIHIITNQKGSAIFEGLLQEELINWLKSLKERMKGE